MNQYFLLRLLLGASVTIGVFGLLVSLIALKDRKMDKIMRATLIENSGIVITDKLALKIDKEHMESFYKPTSFLYMINAGENLCNDDVTFDYVDYCGNTLRMYDGGWQK